MRTKQIMLGLFASTVICLIPTLNQAQSIGELDNGNGRYIDGCGSPQIWPKGRGSYGGNGFFYVVPNNNGDGAIMKLDGRVVSLRKNSGSYPRKLRKGSTFTHVYKGGGYSVQITYTATRVGVTDHGQWGNYAVKITVTKGKASKSVAAVSSDAC